VLLELLLFAQQVFKRKSLSFLVSVHNQGYLSRNAWSVWISLFEKDGVDREVEQMQRFMLKSKIHRATLTGTDLNYQGSITIDESLLEEADILPGEQVHVLNTNNGERFITYAIAAPRRSGTVLLNGPAARRGSAGDKAIIISYCQVPAEKAKDLQAKVVFVDDENRLKE